MYGIYMCKSYHDDSIMVKFNLFNPALDILTWKNNYVLHKWQYFHVSLFLRNQEAIIWNACLMISRIFLIKIVMLRILNLKRTLWLENCCWAWHGKLISSLAFTTCFTIIMWSLWYDWQHEKAQLWWLKLVKQKVYKKQLFILS